MNQRLVPYLLKNFCIFIKWKNITAWVLSILLIFQATFSTAAPMLGAYSFATVTAQPLNNPSRLSKALNRHSFVGKVGGVAFDGIAVPDDSWEGMVSLKYDSSRPDGQRLVVINNGREIVAEIADWQLIPIANYANENFYSVFTLFGSLTEDVLDPRLIRAIDSDAVHMDDETIEQKISSMNGFEKSMMAEDYSYFVVWALLFPEINFHESKNMQKISQLRTHRILNYNPAFANTLLGLRAFQSDILIFDSDAVNLPCNPPCASASDYILGKGETPPDIQKNRQAFQELDKFITEMTQKLGKDRLFQSYVITDYGQKVAFGSRNGKLYLTGYPHWYLWELDQNVVEKNNTLIARLNDPNLKSSDRNAIQVKIENMWNPDSDAPMPPSFVPGKKEDIAPSVLSSDTSETLVKYLMAESIEVSRKVYELKGVNPAVYQALKKIMRYSNFFRYAKQTNPINWTMFLNSIQGRSFQPVVETPTLMFDKNAIERVSHSLGLEPKITERTSRVQAFLEAKQYVRGQIRTGLGLLNDYMPLMKVKQNEIYASIYPSPYEPPKAERPNKRIHKLYPDSIYPVIPINSVNDSGSNGKWYEIRYLYNGKFQEGFTKATNLEPFL